MAPDAVPGEVHDQGGVRGLPLVDRARRAVRVGQQRRRGTTCGWRRPARGKPSAVERVEARQQRPVVVGGLGEAQARVEHDPGRGRCRRPASRRPAPASSSRTAGDDAARPSYDGEVAASRSLCARQCMATYVAPAAATTSSIRGSARPPETSLTIVAPAATAARATSARMVSTETTAPVARPAPRSPGRPGRAPPRPGDGWPRAGWTRRRCRACRRRRRAARAPWATAASGLGPAAAVGERVGGDVDDPHQPAGGPAPPARGVIGLL